VTDRTDDAPRRGRPRSEKTRTAIVCAARDLLAEGGMGAATMEAIAARAGCSKATIYKWWPSRAAVLLEGLFDLTRATIEVPEGLDTEAALRGQLAATLAIFREGATGPLLRTLIGEAVSEPAVAEALRDQWIGPRRIVCLGILRAAVARGELRADTDLEAASDQLFGPLYHRLNYGHATLEDDLPAVLVAQLLRGLRAP
jgi:AcrR family transcriptional regulator